MSGKTKPLYYWDTCIFLAWIQEEGPPRRKPGDMEGIDEVIKRMNSGEIRVFTSVLTHSEILDCKFLNQRAKDRYLQIFQRPEIIEANVDSGIAIIASELRNHYRKIRELLPPKDQSKVFDLKTPDAIHLATAIYYDAKEFHTFDGDGDKPGLLGLDGSVGNHSLRIRKPSGEQYSLLGDVPPMPEEVAK